MVPTDTGRNHPHHNHKDLSSAAKADMAVITTEAEASEVINWVMAHRVTSDTREMRQQTRSCTVKIISITHHHTTDTTIDDTDTTGTHPHTFHNHRPLGHTTTVPHPHSVPVSIVPITLIHPHTHTTTTTITTTSTDRIRTLA